MGFLRSKVTAIVFAAVLIGGVSGVLAVLAATRPNDVPPASAAVLTSSTATGITGTTTTTSKSGTPSATAADPTQISTPAATATPRPTATVRPTPTVLPVGPATIHGRVVSVSTSDGVTGTFVLNVSGRLYTCDVSTSTKWTNASVPSFSALRPDMFANSVQGQMQADGTLAAASVDAVVDN